MRRQSAVRTRRIRWALLAVVAAGVFTAGTSVTARAATAKPPADCNTPAPPTEEPGGIGVLNQAQTSNPGGGFYLTKTLANAVTGTGSITYFYTIKTARPANSTYVELLDCAWDVTTGGNSNTADYGTQQNTASFQPCSPGPGQCLTIAITVNNTDSICDRVELKGTDGGTSTAFQDYSNLVGSQWNGQTFSTFSCTLAANVPEVPSVVLIALVGGGALAAFLYFRWRRERSASVT